MATARSDLRRLDGGPVRALVVDDEPEFCTHGTPTGRLDRDFEGITRVPAWARGHEPGAARGGGRVEGAALAVAAAGW